MIDVSLIKQRLSCVDYARIQGLKINRSGDRCTSPFRAGATNPTSMVVYDDWWYDFGGGNGGDVIDFCALAEYGGDKGRAINRLAELTGVHSDNDNADWLHYTENLNNRIQYWHESLTDADREYLHKRRVTDETISALRIGRTEDGRLSIPYYKNGYVCYYATRYLPGGSFPDCKYKKAPIDGFNEHIIWGLDTLSRHPNNPLLVIAEGAFDATAFYQEGYSVISAITGNFSKQQTTELLSICKTFKKVFITFDNDVISHAGEKFSIKLAKLLLSHNIDCIVGTVPHSTKDISDYYSGGGDLQTIIDTAQPAPIFLAQYINDWNELQTFCKQATQYYSGADIEKFFAKITPFIDQPTDVIKALKSDCKKPTTDMEAADYVTSHYRLLYNPKIGFYEYLRNHWELIPDETVGGYIAKYLANATTGSRLSSITKILKAQVSTDELFNTKPVVNFINGTLHLTDGTFTEQHSEGDMVNYVLPYPYLPNAECPQWVQFLTEITDNDVRRIELLQQLAGYVLFPANTMQKCAILIGKGANGKSVFLNILRAVFGETNTSAVEMSSMAEAFQVIRLMTSMLNISAETRTDVSGAESMFKQIVAGDEIQACYKGKDYISFRPRSKMFVACNEYLKSKDTSEGWTRRFIFVDFPIHFVDRPSAPNERLIDRNVEQRLATELSGIFNWVLAGYQSLLTQGYFTETSDTKQLTEEFKEVSNPLIEFIKQYYPNTTLSSMRINNNTLYNDYKQWCVSDGHNSLSKGSFLRRFAPLVTEYRPTDMRPYRTATERGYEVDRYVPAPEPWHWNGEMPTFTPSTPSDDADLLPL